MSRYNKCRVVKSMLKKMEVTVPFYKSYPQGDQSRDVAMKTQPNSDSDYKCALLFEKHCYARKDALFAVKLDPAVLEAQVTVGARQEPCQEGPSNAIAAITSNNSKAVPRQLDTGLQLGGGFKAMLSMQRAALQSLSSQQFALLLKYVDTLRKQRLSVQKQLECGFCKNNGHPLAWYSTHSLRDSKGRVRCPILRAFCCRRCGATGDHAHTIKYCPEKDIGLRF